jgi:hypothetical protein
MANKKVSSLGLTSSKDWQVHHLFLLLKHTHMLCNRKLNASNNILIRSVAIEKAHMWNLFLEMWKVIWKDRNCLISCYHRDGCVISRNLFMSLLWLLFRSTLKQVIPITARWTGLRVVGQLWPIALSFSSSSMVWYGLSSAIRLSYKAQTIKAFELLQ